MATISGLVDRARLEIGDLGRSFQSSTLGDGTFTLVTLPHKPVDVPTLYVAVTDTGGTVPLTSPDDYSLDALAGTLLLTQPLAAGAVLTVSGTAYRYFTDAEWSTFLNTAYLQHSHGTGQSLASLDPVEDYLVALLGVCEALFTLLNDSAYDIDIATPEGISIPRHQRFDQLMQMVSLRQDQYMRLASALNVGLNRIEMFDLRRVSRATGRLVPIYVEQEIEDTSYPRRVFPRIDLKGGDVQVDSVPDVTLTVVQGEPFTSSVDVSQDLTGAQVRVTLRRYRNSAAYKYFDVVISDASNGTFSISLPPTTTLSLGGGPYWWDIRILQNGYFKSILEGPVLVEERPRT